MAPHKLVRLGVFALLALTTAYFAVILGMAWRFVNTLTHPGCQPAPAPLAGLPAPQETSLHTSDGLTLRAWYYPTRNGAVVLSMGGLGGSLGGNLPPADFLIHHGYGVLQLDSRACASPPAPVTLGGNEVLDAAAGLDFLIRQEGVQQVGAYGFSMGGVTVLRLAARYPQIAAVVAEGGYSNLGRHLAEPAGAPSITERLLRASAIRLFRQRSGLDPWQISPLDDIGQISPRPVLLIYGEREAAGGHAMQQFQAAGEPKSLWIVPGGDHGRNREVAPQEYERRILAFFDQALLQR